MSKTRPSIDTERLNRFIAAADEACAASREAGEKLKEARRALAHANGQCARLELHYGRHIDPDSAGVRRARAEIDAAEAVVAAVSQERDRRAQQAEHAMRLRDSCREHARSCGFKTRHEDDNPRGVYTGIPSL